jgi:phage tail-like protein
MADAPITLTLAVSQKRIFPGETVRIEARLVADEDVTDVVITLNAPAVCVIETAPILGSAPQEFVLVDGAQSVVWRMAQLTACMLATFHLSITVPHDGWGWRDAEQHRLLHMGCSASAATLAEPVTDHVTLAVMRRAALVKYLPGIYQGDGVVSGALDDDGLFDAAAQNFMTRFLMVIERLAEPTESRIEQLAWYFDRTVAPAHLLPWLAWCLSFRFDESWDEARRRRALGTLARLYRQRGTLAGMQGLLATYFDERPKIVEHGASYFKLGNAAQLGLNTALGDRCRPHTFSVYFRRSLSERDATLARAVIDANKPAHTAFELISAPASME